ncbi:hypothetical protein PGTUg99_001459 [Puccinia graminis f. sp. tritici]|uniref:Uncharacterized protein n=1 Tax=Puccinia graminis f. sp. tritici TaxID=56615 RepID=A0A5B0QYV1_PUCGR|nr:hypothetical protein PGTUg99_001459 [Puccinia graminis f. sp. tritici]
MTDQAENEIHFQVKLGDLLMVILVLLTTFFVKYKPTPRPRSRAPTETNGSSSRSRMAARWANMERGSRSTRCEDAYADGGMVEDIGPGRASDEVDPADFGAWPPSAPARACAGRPAPSAPVSSAPGPTATAASSKVNPRPSVFGLHQPCLALIRLV